MPRQVRAKLCLDKSVRPKYLIESSEGFESGGSTPKTTRLVAGGHNQASLQAEDRSRRQAGEHYALHPECGVTNAAVPGVVLVLKCQGDVDFNLIVLSEALLMNHVAHHAGSALRVDGVGEHSFVLGISLLGHQGSWQVQLAPRPVLLAAEATQILNDFV